MTATEPRWIRYTDEDRSNVLLRHHVVRALPGECLPLPKQLDQIRAQHPDLSDDEVRDSYWVCEGYCMICTRPLDPLTKMCSGPPRPWLFATTPEERAHGTRLSIFFLRLRMWWILRSVERDKRGDDDSDDDGPDLGDAM